MRITKAVEKKLPNVAKNPDDMVYMDYVTDVIGGMEKSVALKKWFPELYKLAKGRAKGNPDVLDANVSSQIGTLERKVIVRKMYESARKTAWTHFLAKKHKLYENTYSMALDEELSVKERLSATKLLFEHMPKFEEDKTLVVEVKDNKNEFLEGLQAMKRALHKEANSEITEAEVIDE